MLASLALVPKDGDLTPLGQRPVSVLPVPYRAWASLRYRQLKEWQESWSTLVFSEEFKKREAIAAAVDLARDAEDAPTSGDDWLAGLLDYNKYLDSVSWEIRWPLAQWWGAPTWHVRGLFNLLP